MFIIFWARQFVRGLLWFRPLSRAPYRPLGDRVAMDVSPNGVVRLRKRGRITSRGGGTIAFYGCLVPDEWASPDAPGVEEGTVLFVGSHAPGVGPLTSARRTVARNGAGRSVVSEDDGVVRAQTSEYEDQGKETVEWTAAAAICQAINGALNTDYHPEPPKPGDQFPDAYLKSPTEKQIMVEVTRVPRRATGELRRARFVADVDLDSIEQEIIAAINSKAAHYSMAEKVQTHLALVCVVALGSDVRERIARTPFDLKGFGAVWLLPFGEQPLRLATS